VVEVIGQRRVYVGQRQVRVRLDDLVGGHAQVFDLAGDLADFDVRTEDDRATRRFVDVRRGDTSCFHGGRHNLARGSRDLPRGWAFLRPEL
jgi:hypothetical protein